MAIPEDRFEITITFCFLVLIDIIGNVLVCVVILTNRSLRTPMYYLLVNLAISDIVVAVFQAWRYILAYTFEHPKGVAGNIMCTFLTGGTFTWVGGLSSAYTLVVIAIERYIQVARPHHSKMRLTMRKLRIIVISIWVSAIIVVVPLFLTRLYHEKRDFCIENWPNRTVSKIYAFFWLFVAGVIPVTLMCILYIRIVYKIYFSNAIVVESAQKARLKSRKRFTEILILVTAIYIICWEPVLFVYLLAQFGPTYVGSTLHNAAIIMVTLNSTVNPLLYTFHSKQFRKHLKKVISCSAPLCLHRRAKVAPSTDPLINFRGKYLFDVNRGRKFATNYQIKLLAASSVADDQKDFRNVPEFLSVVKTDAPDDSKC